MQATTAYRRALPPAPPQPAANAQQARPAAAQTPPTLEKQRAAAVVIIKAYGEAVVKALYKTLQDDAIACAKGQIRGKDVAEITVVDEDGSEVKNNIRPRKLHAEFADAEIVRKIGTLNPNDRFIFNVLEQKTEELLSNKSKDILRSIQAVVDGTWGAKNPFGTMPLTQSLIFRSQVYVGMTKMLEPHRAVVLSLAQK